MAIFQGLFFSILGIGLIAVALRSLQTGWLPCGPNGFRGRLEFRRDQQALGYWVMFVAYSAGGLWLSVFALRVLSGQVEPLPLI